jgi:hypothetical protein
MKKLFQLGLALGIAAAALMMAEVERAVQAGAVAGVVPTVIEGMSAADTQLIPNDGRTVLRVNNGGAEPTEVTIVTPGEAPGSLAVEDRKVTVANGVTKVIGPFDRGTYNNSKGQLEVKFSKVASVKLEILSVAQV